MNVNRAPTSPFIPITQFMPREIARQGQGHAPAPQGPTKQQGTPAVLVAPTPPTGMRWAKPGERPPSKYAPGEDDHVIDRFDAWVTGGGMRHG